MNFGNFALGLGILYATYYGVNILYDIYFKKSLKRKEEETEHDVDISDIVNSEEYAAVEVEVNGEEEKQEEIKEEEEGTKVEIMGGIKFGDLKKMCESPVTLAAAKTMYEGIQQID